MIGSEEFFDWMIDAGAKFSWFFTYMPVGKGAPTSLMVSAEQRTLLLMTHDYAGPSPAVCGDEGLSQGTAVRVKAGERLIKYQDLAVAEKGPHQGQAPLHPSRVLADFLEWLIQAELCKGRQDGPPVHTAPQCQGDVGIGSC